ncbi:MAG: UvrD-helicase domain-containing protein [Treponema sp.]|nr:UvrD-helicase domain-containing protein [Treponema sp.]MCL2230159.1 UvrD-helicase domain-containing protein [Treponema sp.]
MTRINTELNEPQQKAVRTIEGPVLIIAGAGSGKTRVITYRIAHMLDKGIPQSAILALTFTNKAAREMEMRVKEITGKKLQSLNVSTFHAFGLKIIREECEAIGYRKNFSIYDETDKMSLIKESLRECKLFNPKIDLYSLSQFFSKIKTGLANWTINAQGSFGIDMKPVYEEYQSGLRIFNAVDFDDLLTIPLLLLESRADILQKYVQKYRYILVDEFQDTSLIQYRFLRLLAEDKNANICVVGDDDQSIYSWRGANYENLLMFESDFPNRVEIKLEQNYRSTSTILDAANGVISHNTGRKVKNLWSNNTSSQPVEFYFPENETAEANFIAGQIRVLMTREDFKYHDFGVLTRTNGLARNIEEAFLSENIPYCVSGGTSFFQRKEIKDIASYLRVIANPDDDVSLLRIINVPRRGIGKNTIASLSEIAKKNKISMWASLSRLNYSRTHGQQGLFQSTNPDSSLAGLSYASGAATELEDFALMIENFRSLFLERKSETNEQGSPGKPWKLSVCTRKLVEHIDYWSYLVLEHGKNDKGEKKARWKFANIEYFIRMMENWEEDPDNLDAGLYPWLNRISLITRDDGENDNEGKVNLMTIHSAKGLEFPVVFIAGAEKGLIPHEKSIEESQDESGGSQTAGSLEEERRLFYVAITRAREKLYISSCQKRRHLSNTVECSPSPFLDEIPKELVKIHVKEKEEETDDTQAGKFMEQMKAFFD